MTAELAWQTTLRGGLWNARRDRPGRRVRRYLRRIVHRHRLDFVLLQEFTGYVAYLRANPIKGYQLLAPHQPGPGDDQNPILVRNGIPVDHVGVKQMSVDGWRTADGHDHAPVYSVRALLAGWLRLLSIHAPVSVSWDGAGNPQGPPERVDDYLVHADRVAQFFHRAADGYFTLVGGDWNARTWERGRGTPHDVARRTGARIYEPPRRQGPGHDGIDFVLSDVRVVAVTKRGTGGSDHPFITFGVQRLAP